MAFPMQYNTYSRNNNDVGVYACESFGQMDAFNLRAKTFKLFSSYFWILTVDIKICRESQ